MVEPQFLKRVSTFIMWLFIAFILSIAASATIYMSTTDTSYHYLYSTISVLAYLIYAYIIICKWIKLRKKRKFATLKTNIISLTLSLIIMLIVNVWINNGNGQKSTLNLTEPNSITILYIFIFYVCFAPIVEETICRGWFLSLFFKSISSNKLENTIKIIGGCIISSYISTMMHGFTNIMTIVPIFVNGFLASVLYIKSNTIVLPIIFHVSINFLAWISILL